VDSCAPSTHTAEGYQGARWTPLALQDAALRSPDLPTRRRIGKALAELDEALRSLMDLAFGPPRLCNDGSRPGEPASSARHWLTEAESALDLAATALIRAGELGPNWCQEFDGVPRALRSKLAMLLVMANGATPAERPAAAIPGRQP
jgi:hypothetical protein